MMNEIPRPADHAPRLNIIDRIAGYFSPAAGLNRMKARAGLESSGWSGWWGNGGAQWTGSAGPGGFEAGRRARRGTQNWRPRGGSANADILPDCFDLRARSRDLTRNVPVAAGAIATVLTHVLGEGLRLQAAIDSETLGLSSDAANAWEKAAEREWKLFCGNCDLTGVQTFEEQQKLMLRAVLESGDVFLVRRYRKGKPYGTKIQILEADRVSNPRWSADAPNLAGGVEIDDDGVPVAYHITNRHPGALLPRSAVEWTRTAAKTPGGMQTVLHLFLKTRPEQSRGVPFLAPVIEYFKQFGDFSDAEVRAAVLSAFFTVFVTSPVDQTQFPIVGEPAPDEGLDDNEKKLGSGAVIALNTGEDVKFADPTRPNSQFEQFMNAFLQQIGAGLELPYELLIKHFSASYSASRAALDMAWHSFRCRRTWFGSLACQTVYGWMLDEAIAQGRLAAPGYFEDPAIKLAYSGAQWIGPGRSTIDPLKDAQSDEAYLAMNIIGREEIRAERFGDRGDWETLVPQLARETKECQKAGLQAAPPAAGQGKSSNPDETNRLDAAGTA